MALMTWDNLGDKRYETGVDHGVLYLPDSLGVYSEAYPWNGLTGVTESPSGAEANKQYADNIVYLNLTSAEEYGFTIEAFTYPNEFGVCDGSVEPTAGLSIGQQSRRVFGFSYRTKIGNDIDGQDHGYKLHLAYGCLAAPSEKAYTTVNDSPEAIAFSWEISTTPVPVGVDDLKPTSLITIDSTKTNPDALAALEAILYDDLSGRLPTPAEVIDILQATNTTPQEVLLVDDDTFRIPSTSGYHYVADKGVVDESTDTITAGSILSAGDFLISENTTVTAVAESGTTFAPGATTSWEFVYTP